MATLTELRVRSASTGTAHKNKLKRTLKIGSYTVAGVVGAILLTWWVTGAINSNLQQTPTPTQVATSRTLAVTNDCPGRSETFNLAPGEEKVINSNYCQLRWKIRSGSLKALRSGDELIASNVRPGEEKSVPSGLYKVVALSPVRLTRTECERRATGDNLNTCD